MESKYPENNPYSLFMIKNFNSYAKFFSIKKGIPRFITWSHSSARACKMMFTISNIYKFREKSSLWHRRAIFNRHRINRLLLKKESVWEDRYQILSDRVNSHKEINYKNLYDTKAIYISNSLNCFARDFKNNKTHPSFWINTLNRIQRVFGTKDRSVKHDLWEESFRRSYRSLLLWKDPWESRLQIFVRFWNG